MNHFCTCFDAAFLPQGLALWDSLRALAPDSTLWVLALDEETGAALRARASEGLRLVSLATLEAGDDALAAAKQNRSRSEYCFTLSPCWPRWLLSCHPELPGITSLDADLYFFASPQPFFAEIEAAGASVAIVGHRFPPALRDLEPWGRYNVGIQYFRNDAAGRAVLDDWRARCLDWCHDRLEPERFADQKYLEAWPERFGAAVHVVNHPGINVAPWNWSGSAWRSEAGGIQVDGHSLIAFHFAKFRPWFPGVWDSGQLDLAVMPRWLRRAVYEPYWQALKASGFPIPQVSRGRRPGVTGWALRLMFGALWWRAGGAWIALGLGPMGRYSGAWICAWRRRRKS